MTINDVSVVPAPRKSKGTRLDAAQCWHHCPGHAAMNPMWETFSDEALVEEGVAWQHPVGNISRVDEYEKLCPACVEERRAKNHPVG